MAKLSNQESVKHDFFRRLSRGESVDLACRKSGLSDPATISLYLDEYRKDHSTNGTELLHIESIQIAVHTLKELADGGTEEDRIRCDAAKALLKFASDNLKNKSDSKIEAVKAAVTSSLWDF